MVAGTSRAMRCGPLVRARFEAVVNWHQVILAFLVPNCSCSNHMVLTLDGKDTWCIHFLAGPSPVSAGPVPGRN